MVKPKNAERSPELINRIFTGWQFYPVNSSDGMDVGDYLADEVLDTLTEPELRSFAFSALLDLMENPPMGRTYPRLGEPRRV